MPYIFSGRMERDIRLYPVTYRGAEEIKALLKEFHKNNP